MMLKKLICFLFLCCFDSNFIFSQTFIQSVGGSVSLMSATLTIYGTTSSFSILNNYITYFPKVNIKETKKSSFSLGVPLSAGIGIPSNEAGPVGGNGIYWSVDLPLAVDYNFGCKSSKANADKLGGYFGAGFGYTFCTWTDDGNPSNKGNSYGLLIRAGVRFGFSKAKNNSLTVGLSYKPGIEKEKYKTIGLNVLVDL